MNMFGYNAIYELASYTEKYIDIFYVSNILDGVNLRLHNIKKPIVILYLIDFNNILLSEKYDLQIVIPNVKWLKYALPLINKQIKGHLWYDSGLGKEGFTNYKDLINLYKILLNTRKIKLIGLGTKYNSKYKINKISNDILNQHDKFKKIINKISDSNLLIHTACSFEVHNNFYDSYFDSVRVGKLAYNNIIWYQQILDIKLMKDSDCYGYLCENTKSKSDTTFNLGLLKNYIRLDKKQLPLLKILDDKDRELEIVFSYDPIGIKVTSNIKVGSIVKLIYYYNFDSI